MNGRMIQRIRLYGDPDQREGFYRGNILRIFDEWCQGRLRPDLPGGMIQRIRPNWRTL